mmetsp:Transcript_1500/g.3607  ORF Transcript_1500/g.3607 Transcript_1500/m.3607 type:complete len:123 (-) Transcript_1500:693-1061(-)
MITRTQSLIEPHHWQCYHTLIGGHEGWWPSIRGSNISALLGAQPTVLAFRLAMFRNLKISAVPEHRIVFELREGSRSIVNQAELMQNVSHDPDLMGRISSIDPCAWEALRARRLPSLGVRSN